MEPNRPIRGSKSLPAHVTSPSVVGRTILLNGSPYQVVGVMSADFQYPDRDFELWTPLYIPSDQLRERGDYSYLCVARLKAGVTLEQASPSESETFTRSLRFFGTEYRSITTSNSWPARSGQ